MSGFTFEGEHYELLEPDKLLFAEARAIERHTGETIAEMSEAEYPSATQLQAMLCASIKRKRPDFTFSDLDAVPIGAFEWDEDEPEVVKPDPTEAADAATT